MVRPNNALNPESQPWARSIGADIDTLLFNARQNAANNANAFRSLNASLVTLGNQITQLRTAPEVVAGSFTEIGPLSAEYTEQIVYTTTTTIPEWATQATVFLALSVDGGGDPAVFDATFLGNTGHTTWPALASVSTQVDGIYSRSGSGTLIYYHDAASIVAADGTLTHWISRACSGLDSGQSWNARLRGIVIWNQ